MYRILGFLCVLLVILSSCVAPTEGLFLTVSKQTEIDKSDYGLSKSSPVYEAGNFGSLYYIRGSQIYFSTLAPAVSGQAPSRPFQNWTVLSAPSAGLSALSAVSNGNDLLAIYGANSTESENKLYKISNFSTSSTSWATVNLNPGAGQQIVSLFKVGAVVYLQTRSTGTSAGTYSLSRIDFSIPDTPVLQAINSPASPSFETLPYISAAWDGAGTAYFLKQESIRSLSYPAGTTLTELALGGGLASSGTVSTKAMSSISFSDSNLYIVTKNGFIHKVQTSPTVSWLSSSALTSDGTTTALSFTSSAKVTLQEKNNTGGVSAFSKLLASSERNGLHIIDTTNLTRSTVTGGNYSSTSVSVARGTVSFIYHSGDPTHPLLVGTPSKGLWSARYEWNASSSSASLIWYSE